MVEVLPLKCSESNSFWLKNLFLVALEQLGDSLEEIWGLAFGGNMVGPAYWVKYTLELKYEISPVFGGFHFQLDSLPMCPLRQVIAKNTFPPILSRLLARS